MAGLTCGLTAWAPSSTMFYNGHLKDIRKDFLRQSHDPVSAAAFPQAAAGDTVQGEYTGLAATCSPFPLFSPSIQCHSIRGGGEYTPGSSFYHLILGLLSANLSHSLWSSLNCLPAPPVPTSSGSSLTARSFFLFKLIFLLDRGPNVGMGFILLRIKLFC